MPCTAPRTAAGTGSRRRSRYQFGRKNFSWHRPGGFPPFWRVLGARRCQAVPTGTNGCQLERMCSRRHHLRRAQDVVPPSPLVGEGWDGGSLPPVVPVDPPPLPSPTRGEGEEGKGGLADPIHDVKKRNGYIAYNRINVNTCLAAPFARCSNEHLIK